MPKIPVQAGTQWGGLNKRTDPVELSPEQSPDCANVFFYDQTLGLLGPRLGKAYAGASQYTIWGVHPYNISGQIGSLVAYGDSTNTSIDLISLYSVTYPHGGWGDAAKDGPVVVAPASLTRGFYARWTDPSSVAGSPCEDSQAFTAPVNGALWAIATLPSCFGVISEVTVKTFLKFDLDDYVVANTGIIALCGCCGGMSLTINPTPVNCTGKTNLTGIKCTAVEAGNLALELSGEVYAQGSAAALVTEGGP
jgi:hypothetical protein